MQELIKIEKRVIGAEETNSVNARDLHKALEIKKDFTNWIKTQISRAGLRKDVDYKIITVESSGIRPLKEYIITTDSSKHIAMMSQGKKAKEVRDYFIAVEKKYMTRRDDSSLVQIMPVLQSMVQMMAVMIENQNKMMEMLLKQEQKQISASLTRDQLDNIKRGVLKAAKPLADVHRFTMGRATKEVYSELNGRMGVFTYYHISPNDYDEAMQNLAKFKKQKEDELVKIRAEEKRREEQEDDDTFEMPDFI